MQPEGEAPVPQAPTVPQASPNTAAHHERAGCKACGGSLEGERPYHRVSIDSGVRRTRKDRSSAAAGAAVLPVAPHLRDTRCRVDPAEVSSVQSLLFVVGSGSQWRNASILSAGEVARNRKIAHSAARVVVPCPSTHAHACLLPIASCSADLSTPSKPSRQTSAAAGSSLPCTPHAAADADASGRASAPAAPARAATAATASPAPAAARAGRATRGTAAAQGTAPTPSAYAPPNASSTAASRSSTGGSRIASACWLQA